MSVGLGASVLLQISEGQIEFNIAIYRSWTPSKISLVKQSWKFFRDGGHLDGETCKVSCR